MLRRFYLASTMLAFSAAPALAQLYPHTPALNKGVQPTTPTTANPADPSLTLGFPLAGGTFTGPVYLFGDPTAPLQAATKQYVDTKIPISRHYSIDDFTPHADCSTDDSGALGTGLSRVMLGGGGELEIGPHCYALGAFTIPPNVTLVGHFWPGGQSYLNMTAGAVPYVLKVSSSASITMSHDSAIRGLIEIPSNLTFPTSVRTAISMVNAFTGTGIVVPPGATDVAIDDMLVAGWNLGISGTGPIERLNMRRVFADDTAAVKITGSQDISRLEDIHAWPVLTANYSWSNTGTVAISGVTNAGGLVQITTSTSHGFVTGDQINTYGVAGVPAANGYSTITVTGPNTFTINGSTFAGAYTGGGSATLDVLRRSGAGFEIGSGQTMTLANSFAFGHTIGIHLADGAGWTQLIGDSVDSEGFFFNDPSTTGLLVDGDAYANSVVGGSYQAHAVAMVFNSTGTTANTVTGATINPGQSSVPYAIEVLQGRAVLTGNVSSTLVSSSILMADAANALLLNGNDLPDWVINGSTAAVQHISGFGNNFAAGTPAFGNIVGANIYASQFVKSIGSVAAGGTNAATATTTSAQLIYVPTVGSGTGISINSQAVGSDVVVWNADPSNALLIYINNGAGTVNGSASLSLAALQHVNLAQVATNVYIAH